MKIRLAHYRAQGIDYAVFAADAQLKSSNARSALLANLTAKARNHGLRIQKSALAYSEAGRLTFFGTPDLVSYLITDWSGGWTHELDV